MHLNRFIRQVFHWKFVFFELLLPVLRTLGPARCSRLLRGLGRAQARFWPGRKARLIASLRNVKQGLGLDGPIEALWPELAANTASSLARDCPLDIRSDQAALDCFEVHGEARLWHVLKAGNGAILVGSHMGAYIPCLHWLFRKGLPIRSLVQRPRHISRTLDRMFDEAKGPFPQADLFLQRELPAQAAIRLMVRARAALQSGMAVYLCGDIPWQGRNTTTGRLLGREQQYLAIWANLAALTRAPVFHVFCTHLPGGRYRLELECVGQVHAGEENEAVADHLKQLESRIANDPAQAVAHLLWPCFDPTVSTPRTRSRSAGRIGRPSRRNPVPLHRAQGGTAVPTRQE